MCWVLQGPTALRRVAGTRTFEVGLEVSSFRCRLTFYVAVLGVFKLKQITVCMETKWGVHPDDCDSGPSSVP